MKPTYFTLFIFLLLLAVNQSQAKSTAQRGKLWLTAEKKDTFTNNEKWSYLLQLDARFADNETVYEEGKLRAGLGYQALPTIKMGLGYDWIPKIARDSTQVRYEHRFWQQLNWRLAKNQQRRILSVTKLEERKDEGEPQWAMRLREKLQVTFPQKINNRYTPIISDTVFFNLNNPDWVSDDTFDQNRAFIGVSVPITTETSFVIGYLNQWKVREPSNRMNHVLYLALLM